VEGYRYFAKLQLQNAEPSTQNAQNDMSTGITAEYLKIPLKQACFILILGEDFNSEWGGCSPKFLMRVCTASQNLEASVTYF